MQRQPILTDQDLSLFELKPRFVRNYLTFAGKNSKDFLLYISGIRENAKSGQRRFKSIDITYDAFFFDSLPARTAAVKSWLLFPVGYQVLHDTYDPDFFRMAICKDAVSFETKGNKGASMELTFHCRSQRWSIEGQKKVKLLRPGVIRNPYAFPGKPVLRAYGSAEAKLYVGTELITINTLQDYVDLNCETHNAYNASGFCNDTIKSEDSPEPLPGRNSIGRKPPSTIWTVMFPRGC